MIKCCPVGEELKAWLVQAGTFVSNILGKLCTQDSLYNYFVVDKVENIGVRLWMSTIFAAILSLSSISIT